MLVRNIRHIPVEERKQLVRVISIRDVLNLRVVELRQRTSLSMRLRARRLATHGIGESIT